MFTVNYYTEADGTKPVQVFISGLETKLRAKVTFDLSRLAAAGNTLREPQSKHLQDGIFELRTVQGNNIVRLLYFFDTDQIIVVTNGFVKKQQKTPYREIWLAMKRRKEYWKRQGR